MISFCQFGAGRIGAIHAENIVRHPGARLAAIVDVDRDAAERLATRHGAAVGTQAGVLADPGIDAVVISSSTDTHADLVEAAARAGKAVFCEKPLDLDRRRAEACLAVVGECGVPLMVGFNRRFDPHFARLEHQLRNGRVGQVELVSITSRDPSPPPLAYVRVSGGLFRDMMIHDFDMARWLLGEEPVEIFAAASVLVDPAIGEAGDVDTAIVTLRTRAGAEGIVGDKPQRFFLERYAEAYRRELDHFVDALTRNTPPSPGGGDGVKALALADAALQSLATRRAVAL